MKSKSIKQELEMFEGSGNVFEDLKIPDSEEHDLKAQLAFRLNEAIADLKVSQAEIATRLGIKQPNVSQLMNYRLQGFSASRLMLFLVKLGHSLTLQVSADVTEDACMTVVTTADEAVDCVSFVDELSAVSINWIGASGSLASNRCGYRPLRENPYVDTFVEELDWSALCVDPIEHRTADFNLAPRVRLQ